MDFQSNKLDYPIILYLLLLLDITEIKNPLHYSLHYVLYCKSQ